MKKNLILSLVSALLFSLPWLGFYGYTLWVAFVPLLWISGRYGGSKRDFWKMFGWIALAFGIWSGVTTWWIWYAAPIGTILSILITIILFGGIFMLFHWLSKRAPMPLSYTLLVGGWIACEYLYTVGEVSFPWLILGNGFANDPCLIQWYDTTGVFGGSLWVLLANILFYETRKKPSLKKQITGISIILIPTIISLVIYFTYKEPSDKVKVTVVQPNIDPYFEKFVLDQDEQTEILINLSSQAPADVDFIVMPETAIDDNLWEHEFPSNYTLRKFSEFAKDKYPGAQLIVGATTLKKYTAGNKIPDTARTRNNIDYYYDVYNSALAVDSNGVTDIHHKSILVVGVEKMPYRWLTKHLEFLIVDLGGTTGQLGVDTVRKVFHGPRGIKNGAAICYESIYGAYFSEFVRNGAEIMFVITNDGWWDDTPGYRQHFSYSRLRAIETRRSIARSANTGKSGFINQRGEVLHWLGWDEEGILTRDLSVNSKITFYSKYGDYIARLSCFIFILCLLYTISYLIKKRNHMDC